MSFFPALAALAAGLQSPAAPPTAPAPEARERIVVTAVASRVEQAIDETPATVTVIGREALDRALARDIRDAFRYEPGVSVENASARFGLGDIAIRGLEGNRVQMLLDGVRMPEGFRIGSFSNASRNPYDVALLSRIEVLRGPASALYGSDALAGVVSMTTLDPRDVLPAKRPIGGFVKAGGATVDDSAAGSAVVAGRAGGLEWLLGASAAAAHESGNQGGLDVVGPSRTAPNPQDARSGSQLAKILAPIPGGRLRATFDRFTRDVATDVLSLNPQSPRTTSLAGDDRAERTRWSLDGIHHDAGPFERLAWTAHTQRALTAQDTAEVRANTTAQCLSAPGDVTCRREARFTFRQREAGLTAIGQGSQGESHHWLAGAEYSRGRAEEMRDGRQVNLATGAVTNVVGTDAFPTRDFPISRAERFGAFAQDEWDLGRLVLIPAIRYDRFEMRPEPDAIYAAANPARSPVALTDSAWSPKLGVLVPVGRHHKVTVQAATGFRAPPGFDANVGVAGLPLGYAVIPNPDLAPERSRGIEVGLRGAYAGFDYAVTAFRTDYDDLIVSRAPLPCPGDPRCVPGAPITFQSQNVAQARIEGIEARAEWRFAPAWTARAGAAWARGDDEAKGVPLNAVDPAKAVLGLAWDGVLPLLRGMKAGAQVHVTHVARKRRIDESAGPLFATPSFTIVDLEGRLEVARGLTLHGGISNLFDRKHWLWSDVRGIIDPGATADRSSQPGRAFAVQLKWEF